MGVTLSAYGRSQRNVVALLAAFVVAVAAFVAGQPHDVTGGGGRVVLDAVPRDAFLVATIDVEALRASPLAAPLVGGDAGQRGAEVLGMRALVDACGFDPLARVKDLAIAIPEGGDTGDFGLVATGDLAREEFVACAEKIIVARGGRPKVGARGSFTTIEDESEAAGTTGATGKRAGAPKLALKDGGPFLIGRGAWHEAMIDAADGAAPSVKTNDAHAKLRDALLAGADDKTPDHVTRASPRAIVATAMLPKALRERLKGEMGAELGPLDAGSAGNVASNAASNATMGGVLGVEMAGVAITAGAAGADTELSVELRCESAQACDEVKRLIERKRLAFSQDFGVRLIGLGPLIDSLRVHAAGTALSATAHAPTDELARAIDRALQLRSRLPARPDDGQKPAPPPLPPPSARERIVPRGDAGTRDELR